MGGAFGHMPHPFDLEKVKSGVGLINLFKSIENDINNKKTDDFNVKIDGSNLSFKLVNNQFAVDRGTQKPIDVEGITINRIHERYDPSFRVYADIEKLLLVLNSAYYDILPELNKLGMVNDNTIFLNTEFVSSTNVIDYKFDFIAIHGVCQFYEKWKRVKGGKFIKTRNGIFNPKGKVKAVSREINYSHDTLMLLIKKLNVHAEKVGLKVFGPIPARFKENASIEKALETTLTIPTDYDTEFLSSNNGNTIKGWLRSIHRLPAYYSIKDKKYDTFYENLEGKKVNPYHKKTYVNIVEDGIPISSLITKDNIDSMAAGIIILHSTRLLGQAIIEALSSEIGDVASHEGIVIRNKEYGPYPFKLTGDYIVKGMFGTVARAK
jgi:hypothetical protein